MNDFSGNISIKNNIHEITLSIVNKFTENGTDNIKLLAEDYYNNYLAVYGCLKEKILKNK